MGFEVYPTPPSGATTPEIVTAGSAAGWGVTGGYNRSITFNSSTNWTHPEGASPTNPKSVMIVAVGGGGGGGNGGGSLGGGGGGSGYISLAQQQIINGPVSITVGAAGSTGNPGGTSSALGARANGGSRGLNGPEAGNPTYVYSWGGSGASSGGKGARGSYDSSKPGTSYGENNPSNTQPAAEGANFGYGTYNTTSAIKEWPWIGAAGGGGGGGIPGFPYTVAGGTGGLSNWLGSGGRGATVSGDDAAPGSDPGGGGGGGDGSRPGRPGGSGAVIIYY